MSRTAHPTAVAAPGAATGPRAQLPPGPVSLLVVIVNYRSADLAVDCLRSLGPEILARGDAHVVVVENHSGADQFERLRSAIDHEGWQGWASLILADRNGGFAAGNNVAIRWALGWPDPPELVWLLNPDTVPRPGALAALEAVLRERPEVGLVGSRLESLDASPQNSAFGFPTILNEFEGGLRFGPVSRLLGDRTVVRPMMHEAGRVDWVAGASLLIRRQVFDRIGLLDDRFFMYYEEVDFCRRALNAGWTCWYAPRSRVVHLVGQSSDVTSHGSFGKRRPRYWFEARRRYFLNHHGRFGTLVANVLHIGAYASYRLRALIGRKPTNDPAHFLRDLIRYNFWATKR